MTRSHVTMILICKHSCVAGATSNKKNFSSKDVSTKRHMEDAHPAQRKTRRKVDVTFSGARVCTDVLGVFEQMHLNEMAAEQRYILHTSRDIREPVAKWHEHYSKYA